MRNTSRDAYRHLFEQLPAKRGQVFGVLLDGGDDGLCDVQIAAALGWPINCVTGRRCELEQLGYIESVGLRPSPQTGQEVHFWRVRAAALESAFVPRQIGEKKATPRRTISVHEAARILAAARRGKRQKPAVRRFPMPLFEGARCER